MTRAPQSNLTTVVIPAHNAEATLDATLDSVRAQTHRALEIFVVDDGSTDATPQIAARHAQADARVRLLRQPNSGVAAARNAAIAAGQGEFIAPIDADDLWHPQKVEKQIAAMHRGGPQVGLVYTCNAPAVTTRHCTGAWRRVARISGSIWRSPSISTSAWCRNT